MINLKSYNPHLGQQAFHYYMNKFQFLAMICGIRAGKTHSGAREALRQAWNAKGPGVFGVIAPTFHMLRRTTWRELKIAARCFYSKCADNDMIMTLANGREIHGFSADKPDRIRNSTLCGFWLDEGRECKEGIWDVLLGRVLSTGGKGFVTTSPNSFDWLYEVFIEKKDKDYGVLQFPTYTNTFINSEAIESLERKYDKKFAEQEIHGKFVVFEGQVYYTFNRHYNSGDYAFKVAQYNPKEPLRLCCDFNVDPMAWVITQFGKRNEMVEIYVIDEIFMRNSNTVQCCQEFKSRYPNHSAGLFIYGDATGEQRHSSSNITNWRIIQDELSRYMITKRVPTHNPAERDRVNSLNAVICNSKDERRVFINPNCKHTIRDLEQVSYKEGSVQIDKSKSLQLTHLSDALGYMTEKEFSLAKGKIEGLKI